MPLATDNVVVCLTWRSIRINEEEREASGAQTLRRRCVMSIWRRLNRMFDTFSNVQQDEVSAYGAQGEEQALQFLTEQKYPVFLPNRIIPHPQKKGAFLETDAIIYAEGNVFCIEVKRYKGKISFPSKTKVVKIKKRFLFWHYETKQTVFDGYDKSRIVKAKEGNYGEGTFYKEFPNPLEKTRYYIRHLKQFLSSFDRRFSSLFIIPVAAFSDDVSDISEIHSFEEGLIYVSDIPNFIRANRNERFAASPSQWIIDGLRNVPSWDQILTRENEKMWGVIPEDVFVCTLIDGKKYSIPYKEIISISVNRQGFFSDRDYVQITRTDGTVDHIEVSTAQVNLETGGERQTHKLRNINQICIGTQVLR